jgi:hypothetical protein
MSEEKKYIGTYKVVKIFRESCRRQVLERGLTLEEARRVVNSYTDSQQHMVVYCKQFYADKYFV